MVSGDSNSDRAIGAPVPENVSLIEVREGLVEDESFSTVDEENKMGEMSCKLLLQIILFVSVLYPKVNCNDSKEVREWFCYQECVDAYQNFYDPELLNFKMIEEKCKRGERLYPCSPDPDTMKRNPLSKRGIDIHIYAY
ncbi:hypothetical protein A4A49_53944 [Nicotiana attenuata]|uniref:Uncharacterized protein n=1 Tax=Nicotiana attenuata TaxID=49451 RepID=A0A314LI15_NICAT|nr:hypothetical protein A4A49_53944 [Nicotiana attenuata]